MRCMWRATQDRFRRRELGHLAHAVAGVFDGLEPLAADERALVKQITERTRAAGEARGAVNRGRQALGQVDHRGADRGVGDVLPHISIAGAWRSGRVYGHRLRQAAGARNQAVVLGLLRSHPSLEALDPEGHARSDLATNGQCIEIHTCSFKSVRGFTLIGAALDELAFWESEDRRRQITRCSWRSARPPRPFPKRSSSASLPHTAGRANCGASTKKLADDDSDRVLVVNAATRTLNPTSIKHSSIRRTRDPVAADAEFGGEWRREVEAFLPLDVFQAARIPDQYEIPFNTGMRYIAFVDPAGGNGGDSFTLAIAHGDRKRRVVLDVLREVRRRFALRRSTRSFPHNQRLPTLHATATATPARGPRSGSPDGIHYDTSERTKSEMYLEALPLFTTGRVECSTMRD